MKITSRKVITAGILAGAAAYFLNTKEGKKFQKNVKSKAVEVGNNIKTTVEASSKNLKEKVDRTSAIANEKINEFTNSAKSFVEKQKQNSNKSSSEALYTPGDVLVEPEHV